MSSKKKELKSKSFNIEKHYKPNDYSSDNKCVIWRFDMLDKNGSYAFNLQSDNFNHKDFLDKMIIYSNMTWSEIKNQTHDKGKSKYHFLSLENVSQSALERIKYFEYDKLYPNSIFSFAFNNTLRIIGIRINEDFHVVWYDKSHTFCPSKLKHT